MSAFGEKIRILRTNSGVTQGSLASKVGVKRSCVTSWENGWILPSVPKLIELAMYFHVSTDYLLDIPLGNQTIDISGLENDEVAVVYSLLQVFNDK